MHFLLGGIGGIASQVPEVLYAGDVDVAGGNLYPGFVGEYKWVVVSLCRVVCVRGKLRIFLRQSLQGGHFPFYNAVAHVVFFAYNGNVRGSAIAGREQHCQNKQVQ